jgi:UDP-N-acetylmuramoyl-tripeptide--D-alanyl-D-alanine ligase
VIPLTPEEAAAALGIEGIAVPVEGVSIDSRRVQSGDLFVALKGERFDGHDFLGQAFAAGAIGAVVDAAWWSGEGRAAMALLSETERTALYPVADTLAALGGLARAVRRKARARVIAITGSVGKTGTKDLLAQMVSRVARAIATPANENNEIGVPLTLLSLEASTEVIIVEMGMRGLGQVARLAEIAEPDVGVITNVHPVHLELLGSIENVAQAKAEILAGLRPDGVGVVPATCVLLDPLVSECSRRVLKFGLEEDAGCADVWCRYQRVGDTMGAHLKVHWPGGSAEIATPFGARAKVENAMAAVAACYAAGLSVRDCLGGLEQASFTPARGDLELVGSWLIINDTYNASPAAVKASLDELVQVAEHEGRRAVAVLGDMLELGPQTERFHREIGVYAAQRGVQMLWGVGPLAQATVEGFRNEVGGKAVVGHVDSPSEFQPLCMSLRPRDVILFKASRSLKLEKMVELLRQVASELGSCGGSASASPKTSPEEEPTAGGGAA